MSADTGGMNTDPNYANSQDFSFTPTPSPLPAQKTAYDTFNTDYTNFLGSQETVPQLQARYQNRYNIPFLQQTNQQQLENMDTVGNQLKAMPASVNSASQNSLLTSGQKDRLVQAQSAPLQIQYNNLATAQNETGTQLGTANTNMNAAITAEQAQQMKMVQPWLQKYDAMTIQNAAENTQWNATNQWELDRLLANQKTGAQLSEGQQQRLEELAKQENDFQNSLAYLDKQNQLITNLWG